MKMTRAVFADNAVHCPGCDAVPHLKATAVQRPKEMSGYCLHLLFECEEGHQWQINFHDHSGGIWISEHFDHPDAADWAYQHP